MILRPDSAFTAPTPAKLWMNHTVPYVLDADVPNPSRLTDGFSYYNQSTPVTFQPRAGEANYVHIVRSTVGDGVCTSNVGMIGGEQLSPTGVDGAVISTPLPSLTQFVSLRIGGKPAQLFYAGPAPGQVSGVLQINAVVPSDAPSGNAVSVYLVIGN